MFGHTGVLQFHVKDEKQVIRELRDLPLVSLKDRKCQGLEVICLFSEILVFLPVTDLFA